MANESKKDMLSPFPENPPSPLESSTQPLQPPQTPDTPPRIPKTQEQLKEALKQRAQSLAASIHQKLDKLKEREREGEFKDKPNEPQGSGEARLEQAKEEIQGNVGRLEQMKALLDSGTNLPDEEPVPQDINDFFTPALSIFGTPKNGYTGTYIDPRTQDYATLKDDVVPTEYGKYSLNPDTQNIDFEHIPEDKICIPDLSAFSNKPIHEVMQHIAQAYPNYKLPGLEYWTWLIKNPNKAPNKLKDTQLWFCFPGSLVRRSLGDWYVPCVRWNGTSWNRDTYWLSSSWDSDYRVVLLEI